MLSERTRLVRQLRQRVTLQGTPNFTVLIIILISACLVTTARVFAPFQVGKDQASQLEAAENLVAGRGLTTTAVPSQYLDISVDPKPQYLTWWPPAFSLMMSVFLKAGLSLSVSLKIVYALATLIGWFGWAILASHFLTKRLSLGRRQYPVHVAIAVAMPIFFTLGWDGTDIFLWAGIPFLVILLFKHQNSNARPWSLACAGVLFGVLYATRYASLFLALFAFLLLFQLCYPNYKAAVKKYALFLLSGLTIVVPTYLYSRLYAEGIGDISQRASVATLVSSPLTVIDGILRNLSASSEMLFGIPLPDQLVYQINSTPLSYTAGFICVGIMLAIPFILAAARRAEGKKWQHDLGIAVWLLPFAILAFLIAVNFAVRLGLVGIRRYYDPLMLCGILVFYRLATTVETRRGLVYFARGVVLTFIAYAGLYMPALAAVPERNGYLVKTVLGFVPQNNVRYRGTSYEVRYPSSLVFSSKERVRQRMRELATEYPEALFFIEEYAYFAYSSSDLSHPVPGKTMRVLSKADYWKRAFTSEHVKIFWLVNENTQLSFLQEGEQQLVLFDPVEQTKVVTSEFPAGHRFVTNQITASTQVAPVSTR